MQFHSPPKASAKNTFDKGKAKYSKEGKCSLVISRLAKLLATPKKCMTFVTKKCKKCHFRLVIESGFFLVLNVLLRLIVYDLSDCFGRNRTESLFLFWAETKHFEVVSTETKQCTNVSAEIKSNRNISKLFRPKSYRNETIRSFFSQN